MADEEKTGEERRQQVRYRPGDLKIRVAYPGLRGMLRANPLVECIDFNSTGLQFETGKLFHLDERLIIDLSVKDESIDELNGIVCYTRRIEDHYQCGVRFCFEDKRMQDESVQHTLLKIQNCLKLDEQFPESASH